METNETMVVSGIKPTGQVHLGNYLGMIRPTLALAARHEAYVFVADGHAMTTVDDPADLARQTRELTAGLIALGLDPERTVLYRQSDVQEVFELAWMIACTTPKGALNRAHAYKAAVEANSEAGRAPDDGVSAGLFTYPVLMAADILALGATAVPVGADQAQHLEITRDLALAFNRDYDRVFAVPEAVVDPDVGVVPGTDGRKMSKSYDNVIPVFATQRELTSLVRGIRTDSRPPEEPKDPATCHLFGLYRHLAEPAAVAGMADRYRRGGVGYGEVKELLVEALDSTFRPARARYCDLLDDAPRLGRILASGAERARTRVAALLGAAKRARGLAA